MKDLALTTKGLGLRCLDDTALAKIQAGMLEQSRISAIFGRQNSQTTSKMMTLTMLSAAPYRMLRQCAAEIERKKAALNESAIKLRKAKILAEKYREEALDLSGHDQELKLLDVAEQDGIIESSRPYVEGALKDIANLQDSYDQIRKTHNIPVNWDESDFEAGEIEHHVKALFKLAYRDFLATGRVSVAACEYAEQFGVHPQLLCRRVVEYVQAVEALLANGKAPTSQHLHEWLHACYEAHKDDVYAAAKHIGLTELITKWSLYIDPNKQE